MAETNSWVKTMFKEEFKPSIYCLVRELICEMEHYCPEDVRCWMEEDEKEELISYFTKEIRKRIEWVNDLCKER